MKDEGRALILTAVGLLLPAVCTMYWLGAAKKSLAESKGAANLYRAGIEGGPATALTETTHDIKYFDLAADGRIVFIASTEADLAVLFVRETSGAIRPLYTPNRIALSAGVATVEKITYRSDEFDIDGWIVKPADFDPARKYPLILQIHGGPAVMWGAATQSMWIEPP